MPELRRTAPAILLPAFVPISRQTLVKIIHDWPDGERMFIETYSDIGDHVPGIAISPISDDPND